jgi:hypothetical protein
MGRNFKFRLRRRACFTISLVTNRPAPFYELSYITFRFELVLPLFSSSFSWPSSFFAAALEEEREYRGRRIFCEVLLDVICLFFFPPKYFRGDRGYLVTCRKESRGIGQEGERRVLRGRE